MYLWIVVHDGLRPQALMTLVALVSHCYKMTQDARWPEAITALMFTPRRGPLYVCLYVCISVCLYVCQCLCILSLYVCQSAREAVCLALLLFLLSHMTAATTTPL